MHKVGIDELQKFNHIENDRKLQIGQTLVIPGAHATAPSPSPNASVPNG
jgi:LysM repeat protein